VTHGRPARTFPIKVPLLSVDRIYYRGLDCRSAHVLRDGPFRELSDHAAVLATLALKVT
jgi:endonuclease/exonuclease/phosphatase family metal-dependent hydrolase